jgi:hypothetical protein
MQTNSNNPSEASLADYIRQYRLAHYQTLLRNVLQNFTQPQQIEVC